MATAAALLVPLLLIALLQAISSHIDNVSSTSDQLARRTESVAKDVAMRLDVIAHSLSVLANSKAARSDQLEDLYTTAQRIASTIPGIASIGLIDRHWQMRWITAQPYGTTLKPPSNTEASERAFSTGAPALGGLFTGPYTGKRVVALAVPVYVGEELKYCLVAVIPSAVLSEFLAKESFPPEWVASIFDQHNFIVARTHAADIYVGTQAAESLIRFLDAGGDGALELETKEGLRSTGYTAAVPRYGWRIGVAVPVDVMEGPLRRTLYTLLVQLVVGMVTTIVIAGWFGRHLEHWFASLVASVRRASPGQSVAFTPSGVSELDEIAHKLIHELEHKRHAQSALEHSQRSERMLSGQLEAAKRDSLTGLLRRKFFIDRLYELKSLADSMAEWAVGIAFIDLDHFKQINDQFGHHAGDQALRAVGEILLRHESESDHVVACRWGGDEFALILADQRTQVMAQLAERIDRIRDDIHRLGIGLEASIGSATWDGARESLDDFMRKADADMYARKLRGRRSTSVRQSRRTQAAATPDVSADEPA